ncbi:MAG: glycosyltransferase [Gemmatimonadaceae bacterium]
MRVAVVTTFVEQFEAFSLCNVVATQLEMLRRAGHDVTVVACDGFAGRGVFSSPSFRQLRMPVLHVQREADMLDRPAAFRGDVDFIKGRLRLAVACSDVVMTHDILYLAQHLTYNVACRELALEFPHVRWLHWIHSAPEGHKTFGRGDPRAARFTPFPFGTLVYPNATDAARLARQFAVPDDAVAVVPHPVDLAETFDFHPLSRALLEYCTLDNADVVAIYPVRLDRGKQPEKIVRLFAELKRAGASVRLLVLNFHSTGAHFIQYRNEIRAEAERLGLAPAELVFTNDLPALVGVPDTIMRRAAVEVPRRVVQDLFRLTNIYVHPSASETYSLVCQEAAAAGNLLVLNDDFPAMREIYGESAMYVKFSSAWFYTTYQPSEQAYYADVAREILAQLEYTPTLAQRTRVRQTCNLRAVYERSFGPLLEGTWQGRRAGAG